LRDSTPPQLELRVPPLPEVLIADEDGSFETSVEAAASDAESGIAEVSFQVRNARGQVHAEQRDEVPPYRLEHVSLPPGSWELLVTARDHAGNEHRDARWFPVAITSSNPSCALGPRSGATSSAVWLAWLLLTGCYVHRLAARRAYLID
jgi:hypothetical protein